MLLSIIPIDSSIDDEGLTYFAKDTLKHELHIGSLVNIPIKENIRYGIVADILPSTDEIPASIDIRSIVSIACSTPLLAPYQFHLIRTLAHKHFVHAHKVLALFLPKFIFNTLEKKAFEPMIEVTNPKMWTTWQTRNPKPETRNIISFFHNTKNISLSDYIKNFLEKCPSNVAIIFPDDLLLSQELQRLTGIEKNATIVKNSHTYARRYKTWLEARQKKNSILIWTRKLLQYNLAGYEHILYIEEALARQTHSYEHIYPNREILDILAKNNFSITIFSSIPTIESMYAIKQEIYKPINI